MHDALLKTSTKNETNYSSFHSQPPDTLYISPATFSRKHYLQQNTGPNRAQMLPGTFFLNPECPDHLAPSLPRCPIIAFGESCPGDALLARSFSASLATRCLPARIYLATHKMPEAGVQLPPERGLVVQVMKGLFYLGNFYRFLNSMLLSTIFFSTVFIENKT